MNFISLAVSVFISNYIFIIIIRLLPIRRKKLWQGILITLGDLAMMVTYATILIDSLQPPVSIDNLLFGLGSILGIFLGYAAAMMIVLDGVTLFRSKRYREFERAVKQKDGPSVSKKILGTLMLVVSAILLGYAIVVLCHYSSAVLIPLIGAMIGFALTLSVSIYFFISAKPLKSSLKAGAVWLLIQYPSQTELYEQSLDGPITEKNALAPLFETYLPDDYGFIITPHKKYHIIGIKMRQPNPLLLEKLSVTPVDLTPYQEVLTYFKKYERHKIYLDENNQITKVVSIK